MFHNEIKKRGTTVFILFKEKIREVFESKFHKSGFNSQNNSWNSESKNRQGLLRTPYIGNLKGEQKSGHYTQNLACSVQFPIWNIRGSDFNLGRWQKFLPSQHPDLKYNSWNPEWKNGQRLLRTPCIGNLKGEQKSGHYTQNLACSVQFPIWNIRGSDFNLKGWQKSFLLSTQI
jgi:hypothetical protein